MTDTSSRQRNIPAAAAPSRGIFGGPCQFSGLGTSVRPRTWGQRQVSLTLSVPEPGSRRFACPGLFHVPCLLLWSRRLDIGSFVFHYQPPTSILFLCRYLVFSTASTIPSMAEFQTQMCSAISISRVAVSRTTHASSRNLTQGWRK